MDFAGDFVDTGFPESSRLLSTMLLEWNGRASRSKSTKHIIIWYNFIMDRFSKGEVCIE